MLNRLRLLVRAVFLRRRLDREMQEEMELHLERSAERLMLRGLPAASARSAARREFGNVDSLQEQGRDARGGRWIESIAADLRYGLRHFLRTPLSTLTMIVLLALGIGFNSALFTFIYSLVNMPAPGIEPDESLVRIRGLDHNAGPGRTLGREFSYPEYREYAARRNLFSAVTAWTSADVVLDVGSGQESLHSAAATYVTSNYFQVLGVRPILGAGLPAESADHGAPQLAGVISYLVWDRFFGQAPDVLGKTLRVNDAPVTIVGVAPKRFAGTRSSGSQVRVWLPLNARPQVQRANASALATHDSAFLGLAARLHPAIELEQTLPTVQSIAARAAQESSRWRGRSAISTDVVTLLAQNYYPPSGEVPAAGGRVVGLLFPFLILLIPCTNVSALLAGLAVARRREIAVRLSLGAARRRVIRQLVTESVLLAVAAGSLALLVIAIMLRTFALKVVDFQLAMPWPLYAFTFGIAILTGVLFGISPALNATRVSVSEVLKNSANAVVSTRSRLQPGLVVTQIALTQPVLLSLGALTLTMIGDVQRLPAVAFADRIVEVQFTSRPGDESTEQQRAELLQRLQDRFAALPGVVAVVPQADRERWAEVSVHPSDRVPGIEHETAVSLSIRSAPPGYFAMLGLPFVRGRDFETAQRADDRSLIIRSDLARRLWGDVDPIGRRLVHGRGEMSGPSFVVVGVLDENVAGSSGEGSAIVFVSSIERTGSLLVRTQGPVAPVVPTLRSIANAEAPLLPITSARTLAAIDLSERTDVRRVITATVIGGLIALFLCAIGLYAVVAFAVGQRTREIGIRAALGAEQRQVVSMFFLRGLRLSFLGLAIGLTLSIIAIRLITVMEGADSPDHMVLLAAVIGSVVVGVASIATWVPARRAATVDPLTMLRTE